MRFPSYRGPMASPGELSEHVRFLGVLTVVLGAVAAIAWVFLLVAAGFIWFPATDPAAMVDEALWGLVAVLLLALLAGGAIGAGAGLLSRQAWARPLALVVTVASLVLFPFGTAYGIYGLWVLTRDGVEEELDAPVFWRPERRDPGDG